MASVGRVQLLLFVAGGSPRSAMAIENIRRELSTGAGAAFSLEIIDVQDYPDLALAQQVLVTPTLLAPACARRLVGDLGATVELQYFLSGLPLI
jgi:circadian clock protein KaiB